MNQRHGNARRPAMLAAALTAFGALAVAGLWLWGGGTDLDPDSGALRPADADAAALAAAQPERLGGAPPAAGGLYSAPIGSEFVFAVEARSDVALTMALADQAGTRTSMVLKGRLHLRIVDRRAPELLAEVTLVDSRIDELVTGAESRRKTELEQELARPAVVRMRDDGSVVGFQFARETSAYTRNWMRSLWLGFRFVVDAEGRTQWEVDEVDPTGVARVQYRWQPGSELHRTKLAYRAHEGQQGAERHEVQGLARAVFDPALGWIRSAKVTEHLRAATAALGLDSSLEQQASLELESHSVPADPVASGRATWPGEWASVDGQEDLQSIADLSAAALQAQLVAGLDVAQLTAELERVLAGKPRDQAALTDVFRKLQWLLRTDPEALAQAVAYLDHADAAAADIVLSAAGAAGTEAAQALLCDVLDSTARSDGLRDSALRSMFQLAEPGERSVATVRGLLHSGGEGQRDTSLLLLGAFGSTSSKRAAQAKSRDELVAELIAFEDEARRQGRLAHWLAALGNTAHPAALAAARPYLGSDDADLRDRAVAAIGCIETSDATAALLEHAGREGDVDIRCRTVSLLAARDDVRAHRFTADLLAREPSEVVRRAAIQGLARRPDEAARQLLRQVVAGDASPELQRLAGEILAR